MKVVILGNGIAGITAARQIRKRSDHEIVVVSGETEHFFSRTALMYIYMGHMRFEDTKPYEDWFWQKNRIQLLRKWVSVVDAEHNRLLFSDGTEITYDKLVLAVGSKPNKFGWPGQDAEGVQGLYSYQDLELLEKNTKQKPNRAVIVGGGLIGIELAEMLHSRHIPVTILVREASYWSNVLPPGESELINKHIRALGFDLRLSTELKEVIVDSAGRAEAIITNHGERIECQLVGLTAGVSPNIDFLKESEIETDRGILVDAQLKTNLAHIYACGDCAQFRVPPKNRRPIEQVWYTGRMQAETVAKNICGEAENYEPGYWFNSAKFLEIEYQTYGTVLAKNPEGQRSLYWESGDHQRCVHFVFDESTLRFIGMNSMGIRFRHQYFDHFLNGEAGIEEVLANLAAANFDPEFFAEFEEAILAIFEQQMGRKIRSRSKRSLNRFLQLIGR